MRKYSKEIKTKQKEINIIHVLKKKNQIKSNQIKTKQNKTKQNKTKQNKTKQKKKLMLSII